MTIELKCPFPNECNVPVHYKIPRRYVTQILSGMEVKNTEKCIHISYSKESTTFLECEFDEELWNKIWNETCKKYDVINTVKPKHLDIFIPQMKHDLDRYIEEYVKLICELPSITAYESETEINYRIKNPHKKTSHHKVGIPDELLIVNNIVEACEKAKDITNQSFELSGKKASEILTFILSDSDREKSKYGVDHIPIAYGLKGPSLNVKTMWKMIKDVRNKCKEKNINILTEVSDGQWNKIITSDIDVNPLTKMPLQKQT